MKYFFIYCALLFTLNVSAGCAARTAADAVEQPISQTLAGPLDTSCDIRLKGAVCCLLR
jgi:hypothetical protein